MSNLKLWLIYQTENLGYDTYDSAVVVAETEADARDIHPSQYIENYSIAKDNPDDFQRWDYDYSNWASHPDKVTAEYIGDAAPNMKAGDVVCSSFNAG
jgi:hypothetical protein